jgi:hypothetical protein
MTARTTWTADAVEAATASKATNHVKTGWHQEPAERHAMTPA